MEICDNKTNTTAITCSYTVANGNQAATIISNDVIFYFKMYFSILLSTLISSLGVVTNAVNIAVYWKQGISTTVNITFITLSTWDLGVCFLSILTAVCYLLDIYFPLPSVDVIAVQYVYIGYTRYVMYVLSTLVTVYLSVERSICIMLPFKSKYLFKKNVVILVNMIFVAFCVGCFCPAWATQRLQVKFDPRYNRDRVVLWVSPNRHDIDVFVDTCSGMVIPLMALVLITASAWFMLGGIKRSSQFRQQAMYTSNSRSYSASTTSTSLNVTKSMTSKDLKLTKVVLLLAFIFFVCNVPAIIVALLRSLVPNVDVYKQRNLYTVLYGIVYMCGLISTSVNIFVYYNVSSRYKREIQHLLGMHAYRQ